LQRNCANGHLLATATLWDLLSLLFERQKIY
jgi:hypothetical protein